MESVVYPEHPWNALLFDRIPNRCWQDPAVRKQFLELVKEKLDINTEQLLNVPMKEFYRLGGTGLMKSNQCRKFEVITEGISGLPFYYPKNESD